MNKDYIRDVDLGLGGGDTEEKAPLHRELSSGRSSLGNAHQSRHGSPTGCGDAAPAPAAPPTLLFAGMLLTLFFTLSPSSKSGIFSGNKFSQRCHQLS